MKKKPAPKSVRGRAKGGTRSTSRRKRPSAAAVLATATLRAAALLGLRDPELARVIGLSPASLRRSGRLQPGSKSGELALLFVRVYRGLAGFVDGDDATARAWFRAPNRHLHGVPADLVQRIATLAATAAYLESCGVAGGMARGERREEKMSGDNPGEGKKPPLLSESLGDIGTEPGYARVRAYLDSQPFPQFEAAPEFPGYVVKVDRDGARTLGRLSNDRREFVPMNEKAPRTALTAAAVLERLADVDTPAGRGRLKAYLASLPFPPFEPVPGRVRVFVRIDEDGHRTLGRIVNGAFVPEPLGEDPL